MAQARLTYEKVAHMSEEERGAYAKAWLYMHGSKKE